MSRDGAELARLAYSAMSASYAPVPAHTVPSFRLWRFPAAGEHRSWAVFIPRGDDPLKVGPRVRRVAWNRDADFERLELGLRRKPELSPSLTVSEFEPDAARLAAFMASASGWAIPRGRLVRPYLAERPAEFGLEGFDLEGRDGRPIVRMEWDAPAPLQLEAIALWTDQVRSWLEATAP